MNNTILIVILAFVVLSMLDKRSNESFEKVPSKDFYGEASFTNVKIECDKDPITFADFLVKEDINDGVFSTATQSEHEKIYSKYRWKYAQSCENNEYYSRGASNL